MAAAAALGCRTTTPPTVPRPQTAEEVALHAELSAVLAAVETARGLRRRTPLAVAIVDPGELAAAVRGRIDRTPDAVFEGWQAPLVAFGLLDPAPPAAARAAVAAFTGAQVLAFYDRRAKRVVVPRELTPALAGLAPQVRRTLFAHEVGHKLQDDAFDLAAVLDGPADDDAAFARRALVEGDATLMALLVDRPAGALDLDRAAELVGRLPAAFFTAVLGEPGAAVPAVVRDALTLPYTQGVVFAAALWRSGGPDLLNAAYGAPPSTSAQALHPERYLRGDRPVAIDLPLVASFERDGFRPLYQGALGEAALRSLLTPAVGHDVAVESAAGWDGDRWAVYERSGEAADRPGEERGDESGRALAIAWVACFTSELEAREFASSAATAFSRRWLGAGRVAGARWIDATYSMRREGTCVYVVRGCSRVGLPAAMAQLLTAAVFPSPGLPPVPAATFVPPGAPEAATVAAAADLPDLGFSVALPAGRWTVQHGPPGSALLARRTDGFGAVSVSAAPIAAAADLTSVLAATNRAVAAGLREEIPGSVAFDQPDARDRTPLGEATVRTTLVKGGPGQRSLALKSLGVVACGGRAAVVISLIAPAPEAAAWAELVGRIKARPGTPPFCGALASHD